MTPDRVSSSLSSDEHRLALPCNCAGNCTILFVTEWEDDDGPEFNLSLYEHVQCQPRWRDRIRVAWAVLRGREPYTHGLLLGDAQGQALARFLRREDQ